METIFGIVTAEHCYLRSAPGSSEMENGSGIEDEVFSGWAVRLLVEAAEGQGDAEGQENAEDQGNAEDQRDAENQRNTEDQAHGWKKEGQKERNRNGYAEANGWLRIETHYGYKGYVRRSELRLISREELQSRQDKSRFLRMGISEADLLSLPKVQGLPCELILKNAVVEVLETEEPQGWSRVRTAAGREGYVHSVHLTERKDDDRYLLGEHEVADGYFRETWRRKLAEMNAVGRNDGDQPKECMISETDRDQSKESMFRERLVASAKSYLGTQYRWGGKSSQGLDCSGLVFMSYLENGVLIYRDAKIMPDYPMQEIDREALKPGDTIYFPGHVAMYIGDEKYIHSTGYAKNACVTINSLNPEDEDYREDLAQKITAYGSIF